MNDNDCVFMFICLFVFKCNGCRCLKRPNEGQWIPFSCSYRLFWHTWFWYKKPNSRPLEEKLLRPCLEFLWNTCCSLIHILLKIILLRNVIYINYYICSLVALETSLLAFEPGFDYIVHTGLKLIVLPKPHKCTTYSMIVILFCFPKWLSHAFPVF